MPPGNVTLSSKTISPGSRLCDVEVVIVQTAEAFVVAIVEVVAAAIIVVVVVVVAAVVVVVVVVVVVRPSAHKVRAIVECLYRCSRHPLGLQNDSGNGEVR